jgi:hypothetical protein
MTVKTIEIKKDIGATGLGDIGGSGTSTVGGKRYSRRLKKQGGGGGNGDGSGNGNGTLVKVMKGGGGGGGGSGNGPSGYQSPTQSMSHGASLKTAFNPILPHFPRVATVAGASSGIPDGTTVGGGHGNHREFKIELKGKKHGGMVHLQPKESAKHGGSGTNQDGGGGAGTDKTRKNRKIKIKMAVLSRKHKKTQNIVKKIQDMNITELRKELVKKGLIKETSKAPESILRQIASDAQIIKEKSL